MTNPVLAMVSTVALVVSLAFILVQWLTRRGERVLGLSRRFALASIIFSAISLCSLLVLSIAGHLAKEAAGESWLFGAALVVTAVSIPVMPCLLIIELIIVVQVSAVPRYRRPDLRAVHVVAASCCCSWFVVPALMQVVS